MRLIKGLDKLCVVICALLIVGNLGSFELGQISFEGMLSCMIVELSIGLFFGLVGLEGVVMSALHMADEIVSQYKTQKNARRGGHHDRAKRM